MNKCVFLDRDGVLNREIGDYAYKIEDFIIEEGVPETLCRLKDAGYLLIVVTNQAGISKGLYREEDVFLCFDYLQKGCGSVIDDIYFCPYHPSVTNSLCRKPDSLMFEKAVAKYNIDTGRSWMIGDAERDIIPAKKIGARAVRIMKTPGETLADFTAANIAEAADKILVAGE